MKGKLQNINIIFYEDIDIKKEKPLLYFDSDINPGYKIKDNFSLINQRDNLRKEYNIIKIDHEIHTDEFGLYQIIIYTVIEIEKLC